MMRLCGIISALFAIQVLWAAEMTSERWSNGFRLIVRPVTASGIVSADLLVDYSALDEPAEMLGIRQVLLYGMLNGSAQANGDTIRRKLTAAGGELTGRVHQEMLEFTATMPADALPLGLAALAEIVCRPSLSDESVAAGIRYAQRLLQREIDGALGAAEVLSRYYLYSAHPFATGGIGMQHTLEAITPGAVRAAYRAYVTPANTILAVVGRCTTENAQGQARTNFGLWSGMPKRARMRQAIAPLPASRLVLREMPVRTPCVMLTFPVCGAAHADYLPLRVLDVLLAGGTGSRLFRAIRDEQHLAYEVSTIFPAQVADSGFSLYALTRSDALENTRAALIAELARLQTDAVADEELRRATAFMKGRYLLSHQYSAQYAFDLAWYEMAGLGADYDRRLLAAIDGVTAADIQRVARTYFTRYYLVVVIPEIDPAGFTFDPPVREPAGYGRALHAATRRDACALPRRDLAYRSYPSSLIEVGLFNERTRWGQQQQVLATTNVLSPFWAVSAISLAR